MKKFISKKYNDMLRSKTSDISSTDDEPPQYIIPPPIQFADTPTPGTSSHSSQAIPTPQPKYFITRDVITKVKKYAMNGHFVEFKISKVPEGENPVQWFKEGVNSIISHTTFGLQPDDMVGITFCSKDFKEKSPSWISFREAATLKFSDIWNVLSSVFQSNANSLNTDTFCMGVTTVRLPKGQGRYQLYNSVEEEIKSRTGLIEIDNKDNLCLPRAIVTAISLCSNDAKHKSKVRKNIGKIQTRLTEELMEAASVEIPENGGGIPELRKFQDYLKEYRITVYKHGYKGKVIVFEGPPASKKINLLLHGNHYTVIRSLTGAFACKYYCENCHRPYDHKARHICSGTCFNCKASPPCKKLMRITCKECRRLFVSQQCYDNHKAANSKKRSICEKISKCMDCLKTIKQNHEHICGEIFCKLCNIFVQPGHLCYIQKNISKPTLKDELFIFFDLETMQEKTYEGTISKMHEPNLCVFSQRCDACMQVEGIETCYKCGVREQVLSVKPIQSFMEYVLNQRTLFKTVICIAHNGQAFDHQFILNHILINTDIKPELIQRGSKILLLQIQNIKFLDSLNYFPLKLSALPKAFDLPPLFKKGYFPHLFNTTENANYIGSLPSLQYYSPNTMQEDERATFLIWYEANKNNEFDMRRDLVDYCKSDVRILLYACLKFRNDLLVMCGVCPFSEAVTIASACNLVFRRNFLKPNTIGIIPKNGYRWKDNQSIVAVQWLVWEENTRGIKILNSSNGQEAVLNGVKVDGYCVETNQIFEFHGCYYHGHPVCMRNARNSALHDDPDDTLNRRYEATKEKTDRLKSYGYEVIEKWECDFRHELEQNSDMEFLKTHHLIRNTPLNPRDAFYGGRTGNTKMYYKVKPGEKIKYIDVCSLYPWVCKYGKFPIGHPKLHIGNEGCQNLNLNEINGLIKCTILPPQNLYHPILPMKQNNRLMFSLCKTCSNELSQKECTHNDEERAITGTWVIDEVLKALKKDYVIVEIFEIWEYEVAQYDSLKRTGGLFSEMMDKFLKLKQSASGFPLECDTIETKEAYIKHFFETEGILMDIGDIYKNSGLRSLAKLILNSFWGKFGQRENQPKTVIVNQPNELYELLINPSTIVNNLLPVNDDTLIVNWEYKEEAKDSLGTVNVCIAAYTTTQARLKLYTFLEMLGERVLYYDTDSVIYIAKEGEYEPSTGSCIGDMTDELQEYGKGSFIKEFVSGGPKNYAYKLWSTKEQKEKVVCKVKGIRLNYEVSQLINFTTIKDLILNDKHDDDEKNAKEVYIVTRNIKRTQKHEVITKTETKTYRIRAEKRKFLDCLDSVPYGFKKCKK